MREYIQLKLIFKESSKY